jgi:hypothetical protein
MTTARKRREKIGDTKRYDLFFISKCFANIFCDLKYSPEISPMGHFTNVAHC